MRILSILLASIILTSACTSSTKYMSKGDYYEAALLSAKKLHKKPDSEKDIMVLEKSYPLAIQSIRDKIDFLNKEGRPDRWSKITKHYTKLKELQNIVKEITPLKSGDKNIQFEQVDYDNEIISSNNKAADYHYNHAKELLSSNDRVKCRDAYHEFIKAKEFNPMLEDLASLIDKAKNNGITYVKIIAEDEVEPELPLEFKNELLEFGTSKLNDEWTTYEINSDMNDDEFDYIISIKIKSVAVSPENILDKVQNYEKKMKDGWEYEYDENGNVKKDSLGNDIRHEKFRIAKCHVTESSWNKSAKVNGVVEYFVTSSGNRLLSKKISEDAVFEHTVCTANGETDALPRKVRKSLRRKPVPFPADIDLVFETVEDLKDKAYKIIKRNKNIITKNKE